MRHFAKYANSILEKVVEGSDQPENGENKKPDPNSKEPIVTKTGKKINIGNGNIVTKLINELRNFLSRESPTFGDFLKYMQIKFTRAVPTMAVNAKRDLFINPDFLIELCEGYILYKTDEKGFVTDFRIKGENNPLTFVLAHEVYHVFNRTFERQETGNYNAAVFINNNKPIFLWNIATDIEMNYRLEHDWKLIPPTMGYLPDESGKIYIEFLNHSISMEKSLAEKLYREMYIKAKEIQEYQKETPVKRFTGDVDIMTQEIGSIVIDDNYDPETGASKSKEPYKVYEVTGHKKNGEPILKHLPLEVFHRVSVKDNFYKRKI